MVKNCDLGLENAALGLRPRAAFSRPRSQFFTIRTSQPANNIYIFGVLNIFFCEQTVSLNFSNHSYLVENSFINKLVRVG